MAPVAPKMSVHRAKALARLADPTLPRQVHRPDNAVTDGFLHSKRDKKLIRRSAFRAQVAEKADASSSQRRRRSGGVTKSTTASSSSGRSSSSKRRVRRPSKKLVTTLQSLVDALPEVDADAAPSAAAQPTGKDELAQRLRRARTSLRTRPGALKRKEKLVRAEMARFGASLAQLTATKEDVVPAAAMEMEQDGNARETADHHITPTTTTMMTTDAQTTAATTLQLLPAKQSTANRYALLRNFITATMEQNPAFAAKEA